MQERLTLDVVHCIENKNNNKYFDYINKSKLLKFNYKLQYI